MSAKESIGESIITYKPDRARASTEEALAEGIDALEILDEALIPAMGEIGRMYEREEIHVPEMLMAAKAMNAALEILRPILAESGAKAKGRIVIGTVEGDLHDIGQRLVSSMLEGAGYEVHNLGADISKDAFLNAVKELQPDILAMSSLITTTMLQMPLVIEALNQSNLRESLKVIIGGAPTTESYAGRIGADGFAEDAASAVTLVRSLLE